MEKIENRRLSEDLDYSLITGLRNEAKQKLNKIKPVSVGQASRISGVSPAALPKYPVCFADYRIL